MPDVTLSVLDFVGIEYDESPAAAVAGAVQVAQSAEEAGYARYWVSEHHNMRSLACSAPELLVAHVGAQTRSLRVGAAGMMLPNHAAFKVAELFRTLLAMYPGRVDLALGRAPGTDPLTAHVLRRGLDIDPGADFPGQVAELLGFLGHGFPDEHPYSHLVAAPVVAETPELFVLGSSGYGARFAAVNGMRTVFAHHMSPDLAVEALRMYRRQFRAEGLEAQPYSAVSVLAFASEDERDVRDFVAGWTLTMRNLRRGVREPLRPEEVQAEAGSIQVRDDGRMAVGEPKVVAERLRALQEQTSADEVVVVTPSIDRARRIRSLQLLAQAWRATA